MRPLSPPSNPYANPSSNASGTPRRLLPDPGVQAIAKLELMNPGGSMKDRSARDIVEAGLREGQTS